MTHRDDPTQQTTSGTYTLWGTPHSLYTGKIRSYLIKKGIAYRERRPADPDFDQRIAPAVGMVVVPVLETPEGQIVQDCSDMIDGLEATVPEPAMVPPTPMQHCVAQMLDAFGSEGLLPVAMHYRWSYRAEQEDFLCAEFGRAVHRGPDRAARRAAGAQWMGYFSGWLPYLGITEQSIPAVEQAYEDLLDALDAHFQHYPYLLGGRPSIADFGMMAPLFAHLGRDPVPASLMKRRAPNVYRWTERMNLAGAADVEFADCPTTWLADDALPPSLEPVLALLFKDWGPVLQADAALFNTWAADKPVGTLVNVDAEHKVHPTVGMSEYRLRELTVQHASAPHGLWLFAKAQTTAAGTTGSARTRLEALLARTGGEAVMGLSLCRRMRRENHVLVLQ